MKFLLCLVMALFCPPAWAGDVWICTYLDSTKAVYTTQPVQGAGVECRLAPFTRGSFQRKEFPTLVVEQSKLSKEHRENRARLSSVRQDTDSFDPKTSWTAKQLRHKARGERLQTRCMLSGQAYAERAGVAEIIIRRASVTIDKRRIVFGRGVGKVHWKMDLKGKCENPRVEIVPIMVSL